MKVKLSKNERYFLRHNQRFVLQDDVDDCEYSSSAFSDNEAGSEVNQEDKEARFVDSEYKLSEASGFELSSLDSNKGGMERLRKMISILPHREE